MFSAHQAQCLKMLGIDAYQPKTDLPVVSETPVEPAAAPEQSQTQTLMLDWQQAPQQLLTDMNKLFPAMRVEKQQLFLTPELVWLSDPSATLVSFEHGQLITPDYNQLTPEIKKQIWQHIKPYSG